MFPGRRNPALCFRSSYIRTCIPSSSSFRATRRRLRIANVRVEAAVRVWTDRRARASGLAPQADRVQIVGENLLDPLVELVEGIVLGVQVAAAERVEAA